MKTKSENLGSRNVQVEKKSLDNFLKLDLLRLQKHNSNS